MYCTVLQVFSMKEVCTGHPEGEYLDKMVLESFEQNLKCQACGSHLRLLMQDGKSVRSGNNQLNPIDILLDKRKPSPVVGTRGKLG